jgi:hypothetical protein
VPRNIRIDKVVKHIYIIDEHNVYYGISMRESGKIDLYWDMTLIDSP